MNAKKLVDHLLESDPKDLAMRAMSGLTPDTIVAFRADFTDTDVQPHAARPNYYNPDFDWQRDWSQALKEPIGKYIHDGILDLNDFPFGTEFVVVVNPDGSPGAEYSLTDLDMGTAEVIDTYVSQDAENEEHRDANPADYFPRAPRRNQAQ